MTEELKPCPFCGDVDPRLCVGYHAHTDAKVSCDACGAEGPVFGTNDFSGGSHKADAIAAWNNRAPPFVTDEMIKRAAVAISGAPFPSKRSMDKARAVLAALGGS